MYWFRNTTLSNYHHNRGGHPAHGKGLDEDEEEPELEPSEEDQRKEKTAKKEHHHLERRDSIQNLHRDIEHRAHHEDVPSALSLVTLEKTSSK